MNFKITFEKVFYPFPLYLGCIFGVFCSNSNFGAIELCFMSKMRFFGTGNSFLTIKITFENVLYPYPVYSGCNVGIFCGNSIKHCFLSKRGVCGRRVYFRHLGLLFRMHSFHIQFIQGVFRVYSLLKIY